MRSIYLSFFASCLLLAACSNAFVSTQTYHKSQLVPGSDFHGIHGIHGISQGPDGLLYAGSVVGQSIYTVDPVTGETKTLVGPPKGMADDLTFDDDGTLYWTAFLEGKVYKKAPNGPIVLIADGLPGVNALDLNANGDLYVTRVFLGDALYKLDKSGVNPPEVILENLGGLNAFEFGEDGYLYGPLWFKGQVAKINVDTKELVVISDGFNIPAAVKFGMDGNLFVAENTSGAIFNLNIETGDKKKVGNIATNLDNLAVSKSGLIYVTNMTDNSITELNPKSGVTKEIIRDELAAPSGLAATKSNLYIADMFSVRRIGRDENKISDIERLSSVHEYPSMVAIFNHNVITASWFSGSIGIYDQATGNQEKIIHGFKAPYGLVQDAKDSVLVNEYGASCVSRLNVASESHECVYDNVSGPVGLAIDTEHNLFVSEYEAGVITKINLDTHERETFLAGLDGPEGIAINDGALFVAEAGKDRVLRAPLSGEGFAVIGHVSMGLPAAQGMPAAYTPTGVTVWNDKIIVSSDIENALYQFEPH